MNEVRHLVNQELDQLLVDCGQAVVVGARHADHLIHFLGSRRQTRPHTVVIAAFEQPGNDDVARARWSEEIGEPARGILGIEPGLQSFFDRGVVRTMRGEEVVELGIGGEGLERRDVAGDVDARPALVERG